MCFYNPGIKLEPALQRKEDEIEHLPSVLMSPTQQQKRPFHVVKRTRTTAKFPKMKNARAKRAQLCRHRRGCVRSPMTHSRILTSSVSGRPYANESRVVNVTFFFG